jgi:hypothetical protein
MELWCGNRSEIEAYAVARCGMRMPEGICCGNVRKTRRIYPALLITVQPIRVLPCHNVYSNHVLAPVPDAQDLALRCDVSHHDIALVSNAQDLALRSDRSSLFRISDRILRHIRDGVEDMQIFPVVPPRSLVVEHHSDLGDVLETQLPLVADKHLRDGLADRRAWNGFSQQLESDGMCDMCTGRPSLLPRASITYQSGP